MKGYKISYLYLGRRRRTRKDQRILDKNQIADSFTFLGYDTNPYINMLQDVIGLSVHPLKKVSVRQQQKP